MTNEATGQAEPIIQETEAQQDPGEALRNNLLTPNNPRAGAAFLTGFPRNEVLPRFFSIIASQRPVPEKLNAINNVRRAVENPRISGLAGQIEGDPQRFLDGLIDASNHVFMNPSLDALLALERMRENYQRGLRESPTQTQTGVNHEIMVMGVDNKVVVQALMEGIFNYDDSAEFKRAIFKTFLKWSTKPPLRRLFFGQGTNFGQIDFQREREAEMPTRRERLRRVGERLYQGDISDIEGAARSAAGRAAGMGRETWRRRPRRGHEEAAPEEGAEEPSLIEEINARLGETTDANIHFEVTPEQLTEYLRTLPLPAGAGLIEPHVAILEERLTIRSRIRTAVGGGSFSANLINNPEGGLRITEHTLELPLLARGLRGRVENYIMNLNGVITNQINSQINQAWETQNISIQGERLGFDFRRRAQDQAQDGGAAEEPQEEAQAGGGTAEDQARAEEAREEAERQRRAGEEQRRAHEDRTRGGERIYEERVSPRLRIQRLQTQLLALSDTDDTDPERARQREVEKVSAIVRDLGPLLAQEWRVTPAGEEIPPFEIPTTWHQVLDVIPTSPAQRIRANYRHRLLRLHPDTLLSLYESENVPRDDPRYVALRKYGQLWVAALATAYRTAEREGRLD